MYLWSCSVQGYLGSFVSPVSKWTVSLKWLATNLGHCRVQGHFGVVSKLVWWNICVLLIYNITTTVRKQSVKVHGTFFLKYYYESYQWLHVYSSYVIYHMLHITVTPTFRNHFPLLTERQFSQNDTSLAGMSPGHRWTPMEASYPYWGWTQIHSQAENPRTYRYLIVHQMREAIFIIVNTGVWFWFTQVQTKSKSHNKPKETRHTQMLKCF